MPGKGLDIEMKNAQGRASVVLTANRDIPHGGGVSDSESIAVAIRVKGQQSGLVKMLQGTYPAQVQDMITGSVGSLKLINGPYVASTYAGAVPGINANDALQDVYTYALVMEASVPSKLTFKRGDSFVLFEIEYDPSVGDWELVTDKSVSPIMKVMQASQEPYVGLSEGGLPYNQANVV